MRCIDGPNGCHGDVVIRSTGQEGCKGYPRCEKHGQRRLAMIRETQEREAACMSSTRSTQR